MYIGERQVARVLLGWKWMIVLIVCVSLGTCYLDI